MHVSGQVTNSARAAAAVTKLDGVALYGMLATVGATQMRLDGGCSHPSGRSSVPRWPVLSTVAATFFAWLADRDSG